MPWQMSRPEVPCRAVSLVLLRTEMRSFSAFLLRSRDAAVVMRQMTTMCGSHMSLSWVRAAYLNPSEMTTTQTPRHSGMVCVFGTTPHARRAGCPGPIDSSFSWECGSRQVVELLPCLSLGAGCVSC